MKIENIEKVLSVSIGGVKVIVPCDDIYHQSRVMSHAGEQGAPIPDKMPDKKYHAMVYDFMNYNGSPLHVQTLLREYIKKRFIRLGCDTKKIHEDRVLIKGRIALFKLRPFVDFVKSEGLKSATHISVSRALHALGISVQGNTIIAERQIRPFAASLTDLGLMEDEVWEVKKIRV